MSLARFPNFDIHQYLDDLKFDAKIIRSEDGHTEVCVNCPMCVENGEGKPDTRQRLYINTKSGRFYCFNCAASGSLPFLIQRLSNVDTVAAVRILKGTTTGTNYMNFQLYVPGDDEDDDEDRDDELRPMSLPYGFETFEHAKKGTEFHAYLDKRGIPLEYAIKQGWGFVRTGYTANRIVVPFWFEEMCVFWQARDILDENHPHWGDKKLYRKVLNPKGASKSHMLYQYDTAKGFTKIVIVEGVIDAVKAGRNAVAIQGKRLHSAQVELLLRTKAREIVLALDRDAWHDQRRDAEGRVKKPSSIEAARSLLAAAGCQVKLVKLPKNKDPGSFPMGVLPRLFK